MLPKRRDFAVLLSAHPRIVPGGAKASHQRRFAGRTWANHRDFG